MVRPASVLPRHAGHRGGADGHADLGVSQKWSSVPGRVADQPGFSGTENSQDEGLSVLKLVFGDFLGQKLG